MLSLFCAEGGELELIASAIGTAGTALSRANLALTKVNNTSNYILDTSNVITTRIDNLNSGSVPAVANAFPLLYNSHFEQTSDGLSPNKISI